VPSSSGDSTPLTGRISYGSAWPGARAGPSSSWQRGGPTRPAPSPRRQTGRSRGDTHRSLPDQVAPRIRQVARSMTRLQSRTSARIRSWSLAFHDRLPRVGLDKLVDHAGNPHAEIAQRFAQGRNRLLGRGPAAEADWRASFSLAPMIALGALFTLAAGEGRASQRRTAWLLEHNCGDVAVMRYPFFPGWRWVRSLPGCRFRADRRRICRSRSQGFCNRASA
jgi:hypothetical protein